MTPILATMAQRIDAAPDPNAYFATLTHCTEECGGNLSEALALADQVLCELADEDPEHWGLFSSHVSNGSYVWHFAEESPSGEKKAGHHWVHDERKEQGGYWRKNPQELGRDKLDPRREEADTDPTGSQRRARERGKAFTPDEPRSELEQEIVSEETRAAVTNFARTVMSPELRQAYDPEDITQDVLARAWRNRENLTVHNTTGWLRNMAKQRATDLARTERALKRGGGKGKFSLNEEITAAKEIAEATGETVETVIWKALPEVPETDMKALVLAFGLDDPDAKRPQNDQEATRAGFASYAAFRQRVARAKRKLGEAIDMQGGERREGQAPRARWRKKPPEGVLDVSSEDDDTTMTHASDVSPPEEPPSEVSSGLSSSVIDWISESDAKELWAGILYTGGEITAEKLDDAQAILDGMKPESPLRRRFQDELDDLREQQSTQFATVQRGRIPVRTSATVYERLEALRAAMDQLEPGPLREKLQAELAELERAFGHQDFKSQQFDETHSVDPTPDRLAAVSSRAAAAAVNEARQAVLDLVKKNALNDPTLMPQIERILREVQPTLQQVLAETSLASLVRGADDVLSLAPAPPPGLAERPPTNIPPAQTLLFPAGEQPIVRFPVIENAAHRLIEKRVLAPQDFYDLAAEARDLAFTISGDLTEDSIVKIQRLLGENVFHGASKRRFLDDVNALFVTGMPLSQAHLGQVFRNNVNAGYSDGHERALKHPIISDAFPYVAYNATNDQRVRDEHMLMEHSGLDGTNIYLRNDPVFRTFRPPWSWSCRCSWHPVTIHQAARRGVGHARRWIDAAQAAGMEPEQMQFAPEYVNWPQLNGQRVYPPPEWQRNLQFDEEFEQKHPRHKAGSSTP